MYECEIKADSIAPCGKRLTTLVITYPRFVHAELLTHRMFSRNSASSRAIPNEKLRQRILADCAVPVWWGKNQPGMQAREELDGIARHDAELMWKNACWAMLDAAERLTKLGLHKQIANRLVEPWMPITVLISATEWENFFRLRCHPDAQPEIRAAAEVMRTAIEQSRPIALPAGGWHLPFTSELERQALDCATELATARCARISYLTHDGLRDMEEDRGLYRKLAASGHWSPFEHSARALETAERVGNFIGFRQLRADVDPCFIF